LSLITIHLAGNEDVTYKEVQTVVVEINEKFTLKVEVIYSKTFVPTYQTTRRRNERYMNMNFYGK